jgi:Rps23 Pro-64 3,4-dihydroxylase Tpa1-like proline 4-hydroxylase
MSSHNEQNEIVFSSDVEEVLNSVSSYREQIPFPHVLIDDLFEPQLLLDVISEIPTPFNSDDLFNLDVSYLQEKKFAFRNVQEFGPKTQALIYSLTTKPFLDLLSKLTGIPALIPDPYFLGAGFHQILRGGKLAIHADFNVHPDLSLYRRVNLLLYINKDWSQDWGGDLELWDESMESCVKKVAPHFNRMVIFTTSENSFHGHPDSLNCPPDRIRLSLALYYYTALPPGEAQKPHVTVWKDRPIDDGTVSRSMAAFLKTIPTSDP